MTKNPKTEQDLFKLLQPHVITKELYFMRINSLHDLAKNLNNPESIQLFLSKYKDVETWKALFEGAVHEIYTLNKRFDPDFVPTYSDFENFDTLYYAIQTAATKLSNSQPNQETTSNTNKVSAKPKLPKLEIFHFDSALENWPTFRDTFTTLINNNSDLTGIEKFYYLLSSVSGPALTIVKSMPVTSENYSIVWSALFKRYENKRALATNYLDKIFNFKPLQNESSAGLNTFLQTFQESVKALQLLNITDLAQFILFYIGIKNLDPNTRREFEQTTSQTTVPTFTELILFIENHIRVIEMSEVHNKSKPVSSTKQGPSKPGQASYNFSKQNNSNKFNFNNPKPTLSSEVAVNNKNRECLYCKKLHSIYRCPEYLELTPDQRLEAIKKLQLCRNCIRRHNLDECTSLIRCAVCKEAHHVTLHPYSNKEPTSNTVALTCSASLTVLLGTAIIHVADRWGKYHSVRCLIDSGAMTGYITQELATRLGLARRKCHFQPLGLGGSAVQNYGLATCTVKPINQAGPILSTDTVIVSQITGALPTMPLSDKVVSNFKNLCLADPYFYKPGPIDMLIAGDLFPYIYDGKRILPQQSGMPAALHSIFGYIIAGQTVLSQHSNQSALASVQPDNQQSTNEQICCFSTHLEQIMSSFWDVENIPTEIPQNPDDVLAEHLFAQEHRRDSSGRYTVKYPMRPGAELGDSRQIATRRLINLESKLERDKELKVEYHKFMQEYESLGHMTCLGSVQSVDSTYVIPHFCIVKPSSTTTSHRVVFDASCKTSNLNSLNSVVLSGPKLQADLNILITNFRLKEICLSADICKMYRQILIEKSQRPYQHILWRYSPDDPIQVFELNTVTYGVASSPYLAIKVLHTLADDEAEAFPQAAEVLKTAFFMDDFLWSVDTVEESLRLQEDLITLLKRGGFLLRKWSSNSRQVLEHLPDDHRETPLAFDDDKNFAIKVLGLQWSPASDSFTFTTSPPNPVVTKRTILSQIGRQFDPLGFVAPCIFYAKCIMQQLWSLQLGWDESLPEYLATQWQSYVQELHLLAGFKLDRHAVLKNYTLLQIVGFCDASSKGYAAVIYLRTEFNETKVSLLIAKSKVAPLKTVSIPRLELMAAHLLSKLIKYVTTIVAGRLQVAEVLLFTDSSVVLNWLNTPSYTLKTFVATRVAKINDAVPSSCWNHVSGDSNPADVCSRGVLPSTLLETPQWLNGPEWLYGDKSTWPIKSIEEFRDEETLELKPVTSLASTQNPETNSIYELTEKFSSYTKLINVVARCYLFLRNTKSQARSRKSLSLIEMRKAHDVIIKCVQEHHFSNDIAALSKGEKCSISLRKLNPFIDSDNFLRVGGRLSQSDLPFGKKHPLLLPRKCNFTTILIDHFHKLHLHVGPRTLHSILCQKYWILSARRAIRSRTTKCIACFRVTPSTKQPMMGELPKFRSTDIHVFHTVGVDMGGPFYIKESTRKNARVSKAYLCLFVCCATRAVHLETVSSLSTECFLNCFDRFVARRGLCSALISDRGSNFVSAGRHIAEVSKFWKSNLEDLASAMSKRHVQWKHNPPTGSHFGGIYEAAIKMAKLHLKRAIGNRALTFEELTTVFTRIEAVLNSRPLCALSSDPNEFDMLTPSHFLIGRELLSVPEYDITDISITRLNRWQLVQQISQQFWKKWKQDYLHMLQQRQKWFDKNQNVKIGDLVLVHADNLAPLQWSLGRVTQLHPGPDGIVRVVSVRTPTSEFTRPMVKLSPLPLEQDSA